MFFKQLCAQILQSSKLPCFHLHTQVIQGSDISPGVKTFGHSLAGGQDVDGNSYSGMLLLSVSSLYYR